MPALTPETLAAVAGRFKVLAVTARLRVLHALHRGPLHVNALITATGLQQANLSRHLQHLHRHGFVARTRRGTFVHYAVADPQVFALCDLMCGQLERSSTHEPAHARPARPATPRRRTEATRTPARRSKRIAR